MRMRRVRANEGEAEPGDEQEEQRGGDEQRKEWQGQQGSIAVRDEHGKPR